MEQITLKDRNTNESKNLPVSNYDDFYFQEGNGSCDCNRELLWGLAMSEQPFCIGCKRFIITHVDGVEVEFKTWNQGYDGTM